MISAANTKIATCQHCKQEIRGTFLYIYRHEQSCQDTIEKNVTNSNKKTYDANRQAHIPDIKSPHRLF